MMWAERLVAPGRFESLDVEPPGPEQLADGEILVRMLAGGVCGSDAPKFRGLTGTDVDARGRFVPGRPGFPLHEIVGEVVASRSEDVQVGRRVAGWAGHSDGLAELIVTRAASVAPYDRRLPPVDAVLLQPLACVLQAIDRVRVDDRRVAVLGLGPIGILFAHVARKRGARHVVGVDPVDRSELLELGLVDHTMVSTSAEWVASLDARSRPHVVIEAVGHQVGTLADAVVACDDGGTILYFGIPDEDIYPLDMERLMRKNLVLIGGITRDRRAALLQANEYLAAHPGLPDALVTHRFGRHEVGLAFETAVTPSAGRLKVVLDLDGA